MDDITYKGVNGYGKVTEHNKDDLLKLAKEAIEDASEFGRPFTINMNKGSFLIKIGGRTKGKKDKPIDKSVISNRLQS